MKNSLCFLACVEFHTPAIIILALLSVTFSEMGGVFWGFQPFSRMFSNPKVKVISISGNVFLHFTLIFVLLQRSARMSIEAEALLQEAKESIEAAQNYRSELQQRLHGLSQARKQVRH